jgi:N-acetylmuramic acid 6-phosphate etherase
LAHLELVVGPEVVAGSTRMKAGTAQKMVLNMMTTTALTKLGYVYDGYMVGVQATNNKLKERSIRIVAEITGESNEKSRIALKKSNWDVRITLIHLFKRLSPTEAVVALENRTLGQILRGDYL